MSWKLILLLSAIITSLYGLFYGDNVLYASVALIMFYLSSKEEN